MVMPLSPWGIKCIRMREDGIEYSKKKAILYGYSDKIKKQDLKGKNAISNII